MTYYGIYKITNLTNGKMYIGKHITNNLNDGYMGSGVWIKRSIKKHGLQNFRKEWLMFCEDEEELNYMERVYVDQTWVDRSDTYNLAFGGKGGCGFHHTEEWKKMMSNRLSGQNNPLYGIKLSESRKAKISATLKGRKCPEHSKRMSLKKWFNNGSISVMSEECPEGFVAGRIGWKKK